MNTAEFVKRAQAEGLIDVAYAGVDSPFGHLTAAVTDAGIVRLAFEGEELDGVLQELADRVSPRVLEMPARLDGVRRELDEYFEGRRHAFDLAVDLRGLTPFSERVLHELARVPFGETATYAGLAERAGKPKAARAVGTIMNRNPIPIVLPCHRIIGANGSLVGYGGGLDRKVALLTLEGVLL
jgi:methylated-DNA-[protein]-cysteine S-methyltransferase